MPLRAWRKSEDATLKRHEAMTKDALKSIVLHLLGDIAPESDLDHLKGDVSFREQLDLDSMDFLNFVIALSKELGVEIPESDYSQFATLNSCVTYLASIPKLNRDQV